MTDKVEFEVTSSGALRALRVDSTGKRFTLRIPDDNDKISPADRESIKYYPDLNNVCFITRAITQPLSILPFLRCILKSSQALYGLDWKVDTNYYFHLALNESIRDPDMVLICFLHFFVSNTVVRQVVLTRSNRAFGQYFHCLAINVLRELYVTSISDTDINDILHAMRSLLRNIVLTKSTQLCRVLLHVSFFQKNTEANPFEVLFPVPGRLDILTNMSFMSVNTRATPKSEELLRRFNTEGYSILNGLNLHEYMNLRSALISVRPSDYSSQSKKVINELVELDKMLFEMLNKDREEYADDIISHLMS